VVLLLTLFLLSLAARVEKAMNYGGQAVGRAGGRVVGMTGDEK
jgi:hypothetical protein